MPATNSPPAPPASHNAADARPTLESLIHSHTDFVYAAALRQVRDPHRAADVTQAVFLILQQKLPTLGKQTIHSAWLLRTTRYTCLAALHRDRRRRHHEQKAATMRAESQPALPPDDWSQTIDAALLNLTDAHRTALAAIYFEGLSHTQLANRLGITETTARKRVQRAVEKLRKVLGMRGRREFSALALATALSLLAKPPAAPAAVVAAVHASIGGNISTTVATLMKGAMFMMKVTKMKAVAAIIAIASAVGFTGASAYQNAWAQNPPELMTPVATPAPAAAPATPRPPTPPDAPNAGADAFSPANTITISSGPEDPRGFYYGDLDAGKVWDPREAGLDRPNGPIWLNARGYDLSYQHSIRALRGYEMAVRQVADAYMDLATPAQLVNALVEAGPAGHADMSARLIPASYCFRTREGGVGILVLSKVNDNPATIDVRYKLLDPKVRDTLIAQVAAGRLLRDLETRLRFVDTAAAQNNKANLSTAMKYLVYEATGLAEFTRGTPWAPRTRLLASTAQLATDLVESPDPTLKLGPREIRQALTAAAEEINKAAAASSPPKPANPTPNLP